MRKDDFPKEYIFIYSLDLFYIGSNVSAFWVQVIYIAFLQLPNLVLDDLKMKKKIQEVI